jgi:hypothetical protein
MRTAEVKQQRRLVKERDRSVFNHEQPTNLQVKESKEPKMIIRESASHENPLKEKEANSNKKP